MIDKNTMIKVTNRDNGSVGYEVPDLGIQRIYQSGETKEVTFEEIQKLSYLPGGQYIIDNLLFIDNQDAVAAIIGEVEPEYFYSKADVKKLLLEGSYDQLHDCLTFAPRGVVELVKDLAVKLKINDISKRELITEKTGLDITTAIKINEESEKEEIAPEKIRKAAPISATPTSETSKPQRRVIVPQKKSN